VPLLVSQWGLESLFAYMSIYASFDVIDLLDLLNDLLRYENDHILCPFRRQR